MPQHRKVVHCYAEGRPGQWEAFCLEFDLAVQGSSCEDVMSKLRDQIELYVEEVCELPVEDQRRLLSRGVPFAFRLRMLWFMAVSFLFSPSNDKQRAVYDCPLDGAHAAA